MDPSATILLVGGIIWGGTALLIGCAFIYSGMIRTPAEQVAEDKEQVRYLSRTERLLRLD